MRLLPLLLFCAAIPAPGQRQELGLMLGAFRPASRTLANSGEPVDFSTGTALYANYGFRLAAGGAMALFFEVPFVASPQHQIASPSNTLTRDLATLYLTPGLRLKFAPRGKISPFVAAGGGWALFEQSTQRIDGAPNPAPRTVSRGAFDFGAGLDIPIWRFVSLRGEVRDFLSGNPAFNAPVKGSLQHNVLFAGGLGLRF
jgi:opacity protein-like surface antigen